MKPCIVGIWKALCQAVRLLLTEEIKHGRQ